MRSIACDLCVIGAGPGGLTVAAAAAQLGRRVVLVERGRMGGDCLNFGCIPSKALIAAARLAHGLRTASDFGLAAAEPSVDFSKVTAHVRNVIAAIEPDDSQERFERLGCTVIRSTGRFRDENTLEAADYLITARRFVIATGASPKIPPIGGLATAPYFTSHNIFDNEIRPEHLIVIGAGPQGLELAQAYRRLGSAVTVLEALSPLGGHDPELSGVILDTLRREGVELLSPCKLGSVRQTPRGVSLLVDSGADSREIEASHLLIAAGRTPNVGDLQLSRAGIAFSEQGISVDARLKTTNPKVYAIGDVIGGLQFTHVAAHQASLVIRNALFRQPVRYQPRHMPWAIYTDPEFAGVGLSEAEAVGQGQSPRVLRWPFSRSDRARTERRTQGLIKIVLDRKSRVIGAHIVGTNAGELIFPWAAMVAYRRSIAAMAGAVAPYPTLSEDNRRAALTNYRALASNLWVRRLIDVVSSFG
jgi:pyruvate/2-oxoglutarate dehydrogenase complex dihydrolipoamide dehydrogenase (E3) component